MEHHSRLTHEDREARRAVLQDALSELSGEDPSQAALDVVRALDAYMEQEKGDHPTPREPPVADFARRAEMEVRWIPRTVLLIAVGGTIAVGIILSGWAAAGIIAAIWVAALIALVGTS